MASCKKPVVTKQCCSMRIKAIEHIDGVNREAGSQGVEFTAINSALISPVSILPEPYSSPICFSLSSSCKKNCRYFQLTSTSKLAPALQQRGSCESPSSVARGYLLLAKDLRVMWSSQGLPSNSKDTKWGR